MPKETSKEDIRRNPLVVWVGHTIQFCQERKRIALGILVVLVVMGGAGAGYFWYQERQEREAQALLANIAAMYAVYHGPAGLTAIADRVHGLASVLAAACCRWRFTTA